MKLLVLLLLPFVSVMTYNEEFVTMEMVVEGLAELYSIEMWEVEKCLEKTGATITDIFALEHVLLQNKSDISNHSLRRSTCGLTCCAQVAGYMTGAKLEMEPIYELFKDKTQRFEYNQKKHVDDCAKLVKNETDECVMGFKFAVCIIKKAKDRVFDQGSQK